MYEHLPMPVELRLEGIYEYKIAVAVVLYILKVNFFYDFYNGQRHD